MKNQSEIVSFPKRQNFVVLSPKDGNTFLNVEPVVHDCFIQFLEDAVKSGYCNFTEAHKVMQTLMFSPVGADGYTVLMKSLKLLYLEMYGMIEAKKVSKKFAAQVFNELANLEDKADDEITEVEEWLLQASEDFRNN